MLGSHIELSVEEKPPEILANISCCRGSWRYVSVGRGNAGLTACTVKAVEDAEDFSLLAFTHTLVLMFS